MALIESLHPYAPNTNQTWTYTHPGAPSTIYVHFSPYTEIEDEADYLILKDGLDTPVGEGTYSSTALSDAWITVPGDTIKVTLVSDSSIEAWGFAVDIVSTVPPPSITTNHIIKVGEASTLSIQLEAIEGTPPYTWVVPENSILPIGLTLTNGGLLQGILGVTPWEDGLNGFSFCNYFSFDIQVTDSNNISFLKTFYMFVVPLPSFSEFSLPTATPLEPYIAYLTDIVSFTITPTFSIQEESSLPEGLFLNPFSGKISGTPLTSGTYTFTIEVQNSTPICFDPLDNGDGGLPPQA